MIRTSTYVAAHLLSLTRVKEIPKYIRFSFDAIHSRDRMPQMADDSGTSKKSSYGGGGGYGGGGFGGGDGGYGGGGGGYGGGGNDWW
ncbi:hypothetical protein CEXT_239871 [Caerostris extrusa]|uniref:Uncharacterized protein n=1 Tax=Caerostris extrusa TaxID=172846 RepID=A0AAV4S259_CAEEX|nr:hypothetical protein CEXT_239871 [Caerostris extrusa]